MERSTKQLLILGAREILSEIVAFQLNAMQSADPSGCYRRTFRAYFRNRTLDRKRFHQNVAYLRRYGYIHCYVEGKERYLELTARGKRRVIASSVQWRRSVRQKPWDGRWRMVIFDVPRKLNKSRNALRHALNFFGFRVIQESVYAFPHECKDAVDLIVGNAKLKDYVKYLVAEIIEGEEEMIAEFIDTGILTRSDVS